MYDWRTSEGRGTILLSWIVLAAALAATSPVRPLQPPPPVPQEQRVTQEQSGQGDNSPSHPLYVKAQCDHGCGYSEDSGYIEKLKTDPVSGFTLVLALVTIWLGFATKANADAARATAEIARRALTELERPFVYAVVTRVSIGISRIHSAGQTVVQLNLGGFELSFFNFGRSPANLTRLEYEIRTAKRGGIADPIDPKTVGGRELPVGTVSAPDHPYSESTELAKVGDLRARSDAIATGDETIWVTGFVRYNDIFGSNYITGFNLAYDFVGEQFVARGDQKYNYARTEKLEEIPEPSSRG